MGTNQIKIIARFISASILFALLAGCSTPHGEEYDTKNGITIQWQEPVTHAIAFEDIPNIVYTNASNCTLVLDRYRFEYKNTRGEIEVGDINTSIPMNVQKGNGVLVRDGMGFMAAQLLMASYKGTGIIHYALYECMNPKKGKYGKQLSNWLDVPIKCRDF
jgi:hypothetical protein